MTLGFAGHALSVMKCSGLICARIVGIRSPQRSASSPAFHSDEVIDLGAVPCRLSSELLVDDADSDPDVRATLASQSLFWSLDGLYNEISTEGCFSSSSQNSFIETFLLQVCANTSFVKVEGMTSWV